MNRPRATNSAALIWPLGEDPTELENGGIVSPQRSFEAGVDVALPDIIVPARPEPGMRYGQYSGAGADKGEGERWTEQHNRTSNTVDRPEVGSFVRPVVDLRRSLWHDQARPRQHTYPEFRLRTHSSLE